MLKLIDNKIYYKNKMLDSNVSSQIKLISTPNGHKVIGEEVQISLNISRKLYDEIFLGKLEYVINEIKYNITYVLQDDDYVKVKLIKE
jgi:hypothetical protein